MSIVFNLAFAISTVTSCFSLFFLSINLYFLIPVVIELFFNPIAKLAMPTRTRTKEAKAEIETHPVTAEHKISKCAI